MSEPERPIPQFGEYATPEEQRARIQVPVEHVHDEPVPIARAVHEEPTKHAAYRVPSSAANRAANSADRIATLVLLALGAFNVATTAPGMLNLPATLNASFHQFGIGSYSATPVASALGIGLAIFYVVAWIATLLLSLRALRAERLAFWIPLVAGIVVTVVVMVCFVVLLMGDPAFMEYVTRNSP